MLRRSKKLASLILITGIGLVIVGCGNKDNNKKVDETNKDALTTMSKNDAEKSENNENNNETKAEGANEETLKEEVTNITSINKENNSTSSSRSKPDTTKPSTSTSSSTSKPSTTKPNISTNGSSSKPKERTWEYMSSLSKERFDALNQYRKDNCVEPLKYSSSEQSRANKQAESNAKNNILSKHDIDQISLGNYVGTSRSFINQWSNSSGHKKNMLDSEYTEGAVSVYKDSNGAYYVVASFYLDW